MAASRARRGRSIGDLRQSETAVRKPPCWQRLTAPDNPCQDRGQPDFGPRYCRERRPVGTYRLPPLDLFRTSESVARHGSFTLAADERCLTQSAVSRQIKALEAALGLRLLRHLHRAIEVTAKWHRLLEAVTRGLDDLSGCLAELGAASRTPQITVAASVAFAWFWLMPRLERFDTIQPVLPGTREVDVAILFGSCRWDGLWARLLFGERVYPVDRKVETQDGHYLCASEQVDRKPGINDLMERLGKEAQHVTDIGIPLGS